MIPVAFGLLFGPAGAWGMAIGNMLGDIFGGSFALGSIFGLVGNFLLAYIPYKLWANIGVLKKEESLPDLKGVKKIIMFMVIAILANAACSMFIAWGVDLLGIAPFSIIGTTIFINNTIASCTLGFVLTILLFPRIKKWNLYWMDVMTEEDLPKGGVLAKVGAYITSILVIICFPLGLVFAYSIGGIQVPIVMVIAGIGSIGCLVGGILMN